MDVSLRAIFFFVVTIMELLKLGLLHHCDVVALIFLSLLLSWNFPHITVAELACLVAWIMSASITRWSGEPRRQPHKHSRAL